MLDEDTQPKTLWSQTQFDMLYLALDRGQSDIFIKDGDAVVLADFGCATEAFMTAKLDGNAASRPAEYAQIKDKELVNHRKFDSWAMGCLLYEMLGEPHPFFRHGPDGTERPESEWHTNNPRLPPGYERLQEVANHLLERDPRVYQADQLVPSGLGLGDARELDVPSRVSRTLEPGPASGDARPGMKHQASVLLTAWIEAS